MHDNYVSKLLVMGILSSATNAVGCFVAIGWGINRGCCSQRSAAQGRGAKCLEASYHCESWLLRFCYIKGTVCVCGSVQS